MREQKGFDVARYLAVRVRYETFVRHQFEKDMAFLLCFF